MQTFVFDTKRTDIANFESTRNQLANTLANINYNQYSREEISDMSSNLSNLEFDIIDMYCVIDAQEQTALRQYASTLVENLTMDERRRVKASLTVAHNDLMERTQGIGIYDNRHNIGQMHRIEFITKFIETLPLTA